MKYQRDLFFSQIIFWGIKRRTRVRKRKIYKSIRPKIQLGDLNTIWI